ncbi:MAG: pilus assembly protein TadG-related protein [Actinobacteria bacterium]|nr:pilus assembly protein TadG-related protein [Actinomycetota bacterium]
MTHRDERGAVTVWLAGASVLMVSIIGITVDLGGQLHAKERAHTIAAQAARTAAEQITADAMLGTEPKLDVGRARTAANAYLRAAGVDGTVSISGGIRITVTVVDTYQPLFLGSIGVGTLTVSASSTAELKRALDGSER